MLVVMWLQWINRWAPVMPADENGDLSISEVQHLCTYRVPIMATPMSGTDSLVGSTLPRLQWG